MRLQDKFYDYLNDYYIYPNEIEKISNDLTDIAEAENKELKKLKFWNCKNESINGECQCEICQYVRKLEELIPDEDLRNKVMLLDDGLHEAMETRVIDLAMENAELKSQLDSMKKFSRAEVEKIFKKGLKFLPNRPIYHYFSEKAIDKKIDSICNLMLTEEQIIDAIKKEVDMKDTGHSEFINYIQIQNISKTLIGGK